MRRAIGSPTKQQDASQQAARAIGCMVCHYRINAGLQDRQCGPTAIHHRNIGDKHGQKQMGQAFFVALGDYHHQGIPLDGMQEREMREEFGPSFQLHAREFRWWTAGALPGMGWGTEAWQAYQTDLLNRLSDSD